MPRCSPEALVSVGEHQSPGHRAGRPLASRGAGQQGNLLEMPSCDRWDECCPAMQPEEIRPDRTRKPPGVPTAWHVEGMTGRSDDSVAAGTSDVVRRGNQVDLLPASVCELEGVLGRCELERLADGSSVARWTANRHSPLLRVDGDTLVRARVGSPALGDATAASRQVESGLRLAERHGLQVRTVMVTIGLSGVAPYPSRASHGDLRLEFELLRAGALRNVIWEQLHRVSRNLGDGEAYLDKLRSLEASLWLAAIGGRVDDRALPHVLAAEALRTWQHVPVAGFGRGDRAHRSLAADLVSRVR